MENRPSRRSILRPLAAAIIERAVMRKSTVKGKNYWVFAYWTGSFVVFLTLTSSLVNLFMSVWVGKLLRAVGNYDGAVMNVIVFMSFAGTIIAIFGVYISAKCAKRNMAYTMRYSIHSYLGCGIGMVLVYFSSGICIIVMSDYKKVFTPGLHLTDYANSSYTRDVVDSMQSRLRCCGYHDQTEWFQVKFSVMVKPGEVGIPESCCSKPAISCIRERPRAEAAQLTAYDKGCLLAASQHYAQLLRIFAVILLAIASFEAAVVGFFSMQVLALENPETGEEMRLIEKTQDPAKIGTPLRKPDMMNLKYDMASIQSFLDPPGLSTSQFFWNKKQEASSHNIGSKDTK